ncbi:MAG: hypothetical protein FWG90_09590 [Oscillospiraceae bacterium]|nr:hypothetical protein [Oscillospiraceae bacterium]
MNFNQSNMNQLLDVISKKLGVPPETLKKEFEQGKFDAALKGMKTSDAQAFSQVMNNPQMINKMMNTPQAQALYKKLSGEK